MGELLIGSQPARSKALHVVVIGCKFGNPITRPAQRGRLFLWKTPVVVVPQRNQKLDQKRDVTEANRQDHQMQRMHADRATQTRETSGVSMRIPCATSELGKSFALPTRNVCWIHNQTENSIETLPPCLSSWLGTAGALDHVQESGSSA